MNKIVNPHDKLFRETWSDIEEARSFLENYLPVHILELTNKHTLEICTEGVCAEL